MESIVQMLQDLILLDGSVDVVNSELLQEALILAPKESYVRDIKHGHCQTFQPQTKRPTDLGK